MVKLLPKIEVQWWLATAKDLILEKQESGLVDVEVVMKLLNTIMRRVAHY